MFFSFEVRGESGVSEISLSPPVFSYVPWSKSRGDDCVGLALAGRERERTET